MRVSVLVGVRVAVLLPMLTLVAVMVFVRMLPPFLSTVLQCARPPPPCL